MAGVKGKSGGPRDNAGGARANSGGYRAGAGRKPKSAANNSASGARKKQKSKEATPRTRGSTWMATRKRILARDNGLCQCDKCQSSGEPLKASEVDHKIPLVNGGADEDFNLQALNTKCHKEKSAKEAESRAADQYSQPAAAGTAVEFLRGVMNDVVQDPRLRVRAAITLAQYESHKAGDGGKKEEQAEKAQKAASSRYAPKAPPKLVVSNS